MNFVSGGKRLPTPLRDDVGIFMVKPVFHCSTTQQLQQPEGHTPPRFPPHIAQPGSVNSSNDKLRPGSLFMKQQGTERERKGLSTDPKLHSNMHTFTLLKGCNFSFSLFWQSANLSDRTNYCLYCKITLCDLTVFFLRPSQIIKQCIMDRISTCADHFYLCKCGGGFSVMNGNK